MPADPASMPRARRILLGVAVALVAANLRPAMGSVGPVLQDLRTDLSLSGTTAALLTGIGVVCFGAVAPAAAPLARRWGMEPVVAGVLVAIGLGLIGRVLDGPSLLFAGTVLIGAGIAVANVLLPALIKRDFPHHTGTMMGIYTMALSGSAAVAAGTTVPLGSLIGLEWRGALGVWALLAIAALIFWLPFVRSHTRPDPEDRVTGPSLLRDPLAWQVTIFFGLQSLVFYALLSWLPTVYRDEGYSAVGAGLLLTASTLVQIPITLMLPRIAARARDQRVHAAVATVLTAAGLAGIVVAPTAAPYLWMAIMGVGQGAAFALGLSMIVWRTQTTADAARLSAMAQSIGYLVAATGPLLVGALHDLTDSWTVPLLILLIVLAPQLVAGILAGRRIHLRSAAPV